MDLIKIGKFISLKRKEKGITQSQLAERLNISDRSISKWENGICLPDASNMIELCEILEITINDLFCGEIVDIKNKEKKVEQNLLELIKLKEQKDKYMLNIEIALGIIIFIFFFGIIIFTSLINVQEWIKITIILADVILILIATFYMLGIEQKAGYYECGNCHYKYIPTFKSVLWAPHYGRTRKMKCPKCGKKK